MARHLYICYRDFTRARVQIAIAAQTLPNNADLLHLTALIDQVQGRWEKATAGLERAVTLDPRNPRILYDLALNYWCLRRYRDYERILDRLVELVPESAIVSVLQSGVRLCREGRFDRLSVLPTRLFLLLQKMTPR